MRLDAKIPNERPILEYIEESKDKAYKKFAMSIIDEHELQGAKDSEILRDFKQFYLELKAKKIPITVLTRNSKPITEMTLKMHELEFDIVLTRNCCSPKPDPQGLNLIQKEWNIPKESLLYIGEHFFDLETATNTDIQSGLILHDFNNKFKTEANIHFTNFQELNNL